MNNESTSIKRFFQCKLAAIFYFLVFYHLPLAQALATSGSFYFEPITSLRNFPTNEVRKLYQDKEGYIWISTYNGLLRYDGYTITTYRSGVTDANHSINSFVNIVTEDAKHNLWIGTHNGLYLLNKVTNAIKKIAYPQLETSNIEAIVSTREGDIWVGGNKGLYRYIAQTGKFTSYDMPTVAGRKGTLDIKSMIEDEAGHIWIGTWKEGLFRYDPNTRQFHAYMGINKANSSHVIFQDNKKNIWIGTWGYGLIRLINPYDTDNYSFVSYTHQDANQNSLLDNIIYAIAQDSNSGKIWVGSRSGLSILNEQDDPDSFTNILPGNSKSDLPFNEVNSIMCSKDGLMWLGLLGGGVCTVNTDRFRFNYNPLEPIYKKYHTNSVRSIYQDEEGILWMGIMGFGLIAYDRQQQSFLPYKEHPALKSMSYTSTVNAIIRRKRTGEICFGTWDNGVWFYAPQQQKATAINSTNHPQMQDECIYSLLEDSKGNLWIGTRSDICLIDTKGKFSPLKQRMKKGEQPLPQSTVFSLVEDKDGYIWAATSDNGIIRIDNSSEYKSVKHYSMQTGTLSTNGVMSLCADHFNRIWAGTDGDGLHLFDRKADCFRPVASQYSLPGDVVYNILEDANHTIWLTTSSEMLNLSVSPDGAQTDVYAYTVSDGLQDYYFNRNSCFRATDNELFFGGYRGLNSFHPDKVHKSATVSPVVITDIKIHNISVRELIPEERNRITDKSIDFTNHITLSHKDNDFSIDFSSLNYINSKLNKYAYKLVGYNEQWVYVNAERRFAHFNSLESGTYLFRVKGASENGVWNSEERTLQITILPPPWLSWQAYCAYLLLILILAYYAYRVIRNRIRLKQLIERGKVERQKIEEINHAKLQFFTNITHELLTPLTIIAASIDELKLLHPADIKAYNVLSSNTTRLIRLIQQILEFRKVENGKLKLRVSCGNISAFLRNSTDAFQPLVKKRKLTICFEEEEGDISGYFDVDKLDKIAYNLLSNAAKYTQENGQINVSLHYDADNDRLQIAVSNSGDALSKDKISHLFERFYEGEYRKFHTIGTGIGLSLTKALVEIHHGSIVVTSDPDTGNTFTVTLPITRAAYQEDETDEAEQNVSLALLPTDPFEPTKENKLPETTDNGSIPTLLLVEDNEELLSIMVRLLKAHYRIVTAVNGNKAIEVLEQQEEIDLVISDVMMPGMDGMELCKYIKGKFEYCHIPVVLLTAKRNDEDRTSGYESGADSYICKPLNLAMLHTRIENLLKKKKRSCVDFRKQLVFEAKELNYTSMDETFIQKAIDCVNAHLDDCHFEPSQLIAEMGTSRTTLADKLKSLTGLTPSGFISNVRLNAACKLLDENTKIRVTDLAYTVGFNDPKYFSTCFKKKFGLSPSEYLAKYEG